MTSDHIKNDLELASVILQFRDRLCSFAGYNQDALSSHSEKVLQSLLSDTTLLKHAEELSKNYGKA